MTDRLNIILDNIPKCEKFADIGCDHGYITKAMLDSAKCDFAIASDISEKCLEKAKELLSADIANGKAVAVVSNGFTNLSYVDCALISGMGGEEIIDIITSAKELPSTLVLQPMKNADKVREVLLSLGYNISVDFTFKAGGKYYDLIKGVKGARKEKLSRAEIKYGKDNLKNKPTAFIEKLNAKISVLDKCLKENDLKFLARKKIKKELKELKKYAKS